MRLLTALLLIIILAAPSPHSLSAGEEPVCGYAWSLTAPAVDIPCGMEDFILKAAIRGHVLSRKEEQK